MLVGVIGAASSSRPAAAQSGCEEQLKDAESSYQIGRFEQALQAIETCLDTSPGRAVAARVLSLQAKIYIAMDEFESADESVRRLLQVDDGFQADTLRDPPRFLRLIDGRRQGSAEVKVSSVSKTPESLREAPATVVVLTAEEIARRGYLDFEQLLHDVPGFDISRTKGLTYSHIYQRGYRSIETNRTLFLIDGVEENTAFSNVVYISRQLSLSNIDRVEIVYGPASTMYGANAFTGVINVITKNPAEMIDPTTGYGLNLQVTGGSMSTTSIDSTLAGRSQAGSVTWSVTNRIFRSDETDLSGFEEWDFDPAFYASEAQASSYRSRLSLSGTVADIETFLSQNPGVATSPYFDVTSTSITLNDEGLARAVSLDQTLFSESFDDSPVGFSNPTRDWLVHAKIQMPNVVFGFQSYRRAEAASTWLTDQSSVGGDNGMLWIPKHSWFYVNYSREFANDLALSWFTRYKLQELSGDSALVFTRNYSRGSLGIGDLAQGRNAFLERTFQSQDNNQLRSEVRLSRSVGRFSWVGGFELRNSSIQGGTVTSTEPNPAESGTSPEGIPGDNRFRVNDLGLYLQAAYRPWDKWKLVAGGRLDTNKIRDTGGFGTVFNPRLAAVYTPGEFTFKAIYSTAFKDPPNFQKFQTAEGRELSNPDLRPEEVENVDFSVSWRRGPFSTDLVAYESTYSGIVEQVTVECPICGPPGSTTGQFRNVGGLLVRGIQANAQWTRDAYSLFGNYTYTDSKNTESNLPTADIADHQINLGFNAELWQKWNLNLRGNWVDDRRTGLGTTVATNPLSKIDAYTVAHLALTYRDPLPGLDLQLIVNNLFDSEYFHPGIRDADGVFFASRIPQEKRSVFLRATLKKLPFIGEK